MLVAAVAQRLGAERGLGVGEGDDGGGLGSGPGEGDGDLEAGEHVAAVAVGVADEVLEGVVVGRRALGVEAPLEQRAGGVLVERVEPEQRRAAEQRRVDLEERVLGGGADERDEARSRRRAAARPAAPC